MLTDNLAPNSAPSGRFLAGDKWDVLTVPVLQRPGRTGSTSARRIGEPFGVAPGAHPYYPPRL